MIRLLRFAATKSLLREWIPGRNMKVESNSRFSVPFSAYSWKVKHGISGQRVPPSGFI